MSLVTRFFFSIIGDAMWHNTSRMWHEWQTARHSEFPTIVKQVSVWQEKWHYPAKWPSWCHFWNRCSMSILIYRENNWFYFWPSSYWCLKENIVPFKRSNVHHTPKQVSSNRVNISNNKHETQKFILKNSGYERLTSSVHPNRALR